MKKRIENIPENAKDTMLGYTVVILCLAAFIIALSALIALVRVLVG